MKLSASPTIGADAHRGWPVPSAWRSWSQRWADVLFAHWPVEPRAVRAAVPAGLDLDLFEGRAWVSLVAFSMVGVARRVPRWPRFYAFPELNLRTYVSAGGRPGVYFLSIDAGSRAAAFLARQLSGLPYKHARLSVRRELHAAGGDEVRVTCEPSRSSRTAVSARARVGDPLTSAPGSREWWLTERYALYLRGRRGEILRGEVHHDPWPLHHAAVEFRENNLLELCGIAADPLCSRRGGYDANGSNSAVVGSFRRMRRHHARRPRYGPR